MLSDAQRTLYYQAQGLSPVVIRELEEMRLTSPSRPVSQRGLKNLIVDMRSPCNQARRRLESFSCEFIYAMELETFRGCHEYYTQVSPKNIVRYGKTNNAHVDFLVLREAGVELVECKPRSRLEALALKRPEEWQCLDGTWRRPALEAWAKDRGITYTVWSPPEPHGIYGANLLAVHAAVSAKPTLTSEPAVAQLRKLLAARPTSLEAAFEEVARLTPDHVLVALGAGHIHGLLQSVPLDQPAHFILFSNREQAAACEMHLLEELRQGGRQPTLTSKLIKATPVDYAKAHVRLARVDRMLDGSEQVTRRYAKLIHEVVAARQAGGNPLEVCLTRYGNSGRRIGQLTADQEAALEKTIARYRRDSLVRTKLQAYDLLVAACRNQGIRPPGRTTFNSRLLRLSKTKRAYATGGQRGFHAGEEAIDPMDRTLRCPVPGLMVHVDSTKLDVRCSPDMRQGLDFECPTLYVAVDSATGLVLGYSVLFGPARRLALAVLVRDVLHRQDFLPRYWVADAGAEYTGAWFEKFCDYAGATRIQPPPGAPRKNSLAENALGRINAEVAHRFLGSTDPDKAGRSVTAKQKSYATACHDYCTVMSELERYLFQDWPDTPRAATRSSPSEDWEHKASSIGTPGVIRVDDPQSFLIATSIPIDRYLKIEPSRGIRYLQRRYVSSELLQRCRTESPIELRIDCVDQCRMYAKFRSGWVLALAADSLQRGALSTAAKLFEVATDGSRRIAAGRQRDAVRLERTLRLEVANRAGGTAKHLEPLLDRTPNPDRHANGLETPDEPLRWADPEVPLLPFDVEGQAAS